MSIERPRTTAYSLPDPFRQPYYIRLNQVWGNPVIVVYSKGNDHIIDATRCAVLAREKTRDQGLFADDAPATPILPSA